MYYISVILLNKLYKKKNKTNNFRIACSITHKKNKVKKSKENRTPPIQTFLSDNYKEITKN